MFKYYDFNLQNLKKLNTEIYLIFCIYVIQIGKLFIYWLLLNKEDNANNVVGSKMTKI